MNQFFFTTIVPRFLFSNQMTAQNPLSPDANKGNAIASFLLGDVSTANVVKSQPLANQRRHLQVFIQDDWKVTRKFTVNIGTEYSFEFPITERYNRKMWFDQSAALSISVGFRSIALPFHGLKHPVPTGSLYAPIGTSSGFRLSAVSQDRGAECLWYFMASRRNYGHDRGLRAPAFSINTPMVT